MNEVAKEIGIRVVSGVLIFLILIGLFEWYKSRNPKKPCDCKKKTDEEIANTPEQMEMPTDVNDMVMGSGMMGIGDNSLVRISMG